MLPANGPLSLRKIDDRLLLRHRNYVPLALRCWTMDPAPRWRCAATYKGIQRREVVISLTVWMVLH